MTSEDIAKLLELPEHLDRWTEKQLEHYTKKIKCKLCGTDLSLSGFAIHKDECEKIIALKEQIVDLHSKGLSDVEIAERLNNFPQSIRRYRKQLGLETNKVVEDADERAIKIKEVYFDGSKPSNIVIAKKTGYTKSIICNVLKTLNLESWTDITQKEEEEIYIRERANGLNTSQICKKYGWWTSKGNRMKTKFGY